MPHLTKATFDFLRELAANNERDWFEANKARYEADVKGPFLDLIAALAPGLKKIDPAVVVDPRPNGGSMMRLHRDRRFAKDKSPYKTFVGAFFAPASGKAEGTPGYYLRIEPGASVAGGGLWQPGTAALKQVRDKIAGDPDGWSEASSGQALRQMCKYAGESLKRPPAGYDPAGPHIEDIKRKDFAVVATLSDADVCRAGFKDALLEHYRDASPLVRFLADAVGSA